MRRIRLLGASLFCLAAMLVPATGFSDSPAGQSFSYTDDWDLVSAPPPPGPYRSVNLDPRIPGQGAVPTFAMEAPVMPQADRPPAVMSSPTADVRTKQPAAPSGEAVNKRAPVSRPYSRPPQGYPRDVSPYRGPMGYSGYRGMPPPGNYTGRDTQRPLPEVPPPPVYDSMMRR